MFKVLCDFDPTDNVIYYVINDYLYGHYICNFKPLLNTYSVT